MPFFNLARLFRREWVQALPVFLFYNGWFAENRVRVLPFSLK